MSIHVGRHNCNGRCRPCEVKREKTVSICMRIVPLIELFRTVNAFPLMPRYLFVVISFDQTAKKRRANINDQRIFAAAVETVSHCQLAEIISS